MSQPAVTKRVVGYVRVSTDKQADGGVSLDAQTEKIRQYANLYDLHLVDIIIDAGESAKTLDRPGLQRALSMLTSGNADGILVAKLDRLMSVAEQIDTTSAAGRLVLNVLMSVSPWEREAIGERTKDAMQHKKRQGQRISLHTPYGYRLDDDGQTLLEDDAEQMVIRAARQYADAGLSLRTIARRLDDDGYRNRAGKPFAAKSVSFMLKDAA